jgi:2'-5' RNA ligase
MHTTSHFIGVSLHSSLFADLFVELQGYFRSHDLEGAIEFQNILSLHITLYYLESSIETKEKARILKDISDISATDTLSISDLKTSYFGEPGKERVCYLGCVRNEEFEELNQLFAQKYSCAQIPENQLVFAPHKQKIDTIISKAVQIVDLEHAITGLQLFRVNSVFRPEIQVAIA